MSFREEVTVAVNLKDKGIEGTLAKLGTALTSIKASADSLEGELDQIEDSVQGFDPDVEETDIKIGAEVDLDDIQQSVTTAKMTANTFASAIGPSNIKIGAVYDQDSSFLNQLVEEVEVMNEAVEAGENAKMALSEVEVPVAVVVDIHLLEDIAAKGEQGRRAVPVLRGKTKSAVSQ